MTLNNLKKSNHPPPNFRIRPLQTGVESVDELPANQHLSSINYPLMGVETQM